jgi:hypothetical protein
MSVDPATCIHCDQIGESVGAVVALWMLWFAPGVFLATRQLLTRETWLRRLGRGLATAGALTLGTIATLASLAWVLVGR